MVLLDARMLGMVLLDARMMGMVLLDARMLGMVLLDARMLGMVLLDARMLGMVLLDARMLGMVLLDARINSWSEIFMEESLEFTENGVNNKISSVCVAVLLREPVVSVSTYVSAANLLLRHHRGLVLILETVKVRSRFPVARCSLQMNEEALGKQAMFTWWISWAWAWAWAWVLWSSCAHVSVDAVWAEGISQQETEEGSGESRAAVKKEVQLGPGMGGSAVQTLGKEGVQHFATQPTPQTAVVGSTAVLPCRVINKVGHLQWTKDGFGLGTERELFGFSRYAMIGSDDEGDFSLKIQPVLLEDDSVYQCQVSASDGVPGIRSRPVRLTVYVPPEPPRVTPPVLHTTAGMTVTLECESQGGRPPPEIQWVDDSRRETIRTGSVLATETMTDGKRVTVRSRLSFTPRRSHHNSSLTCLTSHQALTSPLISSVQLSVLFPPEVRLHVRPQQLVEGDDANFACSALANPSVITYRYEDSSS
ncbi:irregular chiasm C-roughest protein-like [Cherax quadricarinatus]|uniref:irregular chiasm C-roughest protein-like n=1 Tax=Cherax quadricarinatus TaxID=27406 RepID=UPI00387E3BA8